jgi:hypothetical protein
VLRNKRSSILSCSRRTATCHSSHWKTFLNNSKLAVYKRPWQRRIGQHDRIGRCMRRIHNTIALFLRYVIANQVADSRVPTARHNAPQSYMPAAMFRFLQFLFFQYWKNDIIIGLFLGCVRPFNMERKLLRRPNKIVASKKHRHLQARSSHYRGWQVQAGSVRMPQQVLASPQ